MSCNVKCTMQINQNSYTTDIVLVNNDTFTVKQIRHNKHK